MPEPVVLGAEPEPLEPELDPEPEEEEDEDEELLGPLGAIAGGAQVSDTLRTGPTPPGTSAEAGVLGDAETVKLIVCPLISVTVTVQTSAEAVGNAATPIIAKKEPAVRTAILSFRLLHTVAYLLPPCAMPKFSAPRPRGDVRWTLLTATELCNAEPSPTRAI